MSNTIIFHPIGQDVLNVPSIRKYIEAKGETSAKLQIELEYQVFKPAVVSYELTNELVMTRSEYILEECDLDQTKTVTMEIDLQNVTTAYTVYLKVSDHVQIAEYKGKLSVDLVWEDDALENEFCSKMLEIS